MGDARGERWAGVRRDAHTPRAHNFWRSIGRLPTVIVRVTGSSQETHANRLKCQKESPVNILDFRPVSSIVLPDVGDISEPGLTVIVGPNSSGKSQLLRDIYHTICGDRRRLVVAESIQVNKPNYDDLLDALISDNYLRKTVDDNGNTQYSAMTMYLGSGQTGGTINNNDAVSWYSQYDSNSENKRPNQFLNYFGRMLVSAMFLDRRLSALQIVGLIDFENNSPSHDLHALYMDDGARAKLSSEMMESFGRAVWPDMSRGSVMTLKVSDNVNVPTAEERLSVKEMSKYRAIEDEGDGMKSYVATCITLLLGRRPITIVDEPEMCLHPPQAYNLGRFIGKFGISKGTSTYVATHSSHVLRGILGSTQDVRIVRMSRRAGAFQAHRLSPVDLKNAISKPTLRAESVLDGIFSQGVVVVEAEADRLVYGAVLETLSDEVRLDVHFAPVGGTEGLAGTCKLYHALRIPVAVVADLDVLSSQERLSRILTVMTDPATATQIEQDASPVLEAIRGLPPTLDADHLQKRIKDILEYRMEWAKGDDTAVSKELGALARELDRMRRLKRGGVEALPREIGVQLSELLATLKSVGIFLCPVGELEDWLRLERITASRSNNKWAWANEAVLAVQRRGSAQGDVWDFVREVARYLGR